MSLLRSPTSTGSQPDLSKLKEVQDTQITFRKRKQPEPDVHDCSCANEMQNLRTEMTRITSLLEKFIGSNEQNLKQMQEGISDVKNQITDIKTNNEQAMNSINASMQEVKTQINDVKSVISSMGAEQQQIKASITQLEIKVSMGEAKLKSIETEVNEIRATAATPKAEDLLQHNETMLQEIIERKARKNNIILIGIPEQISPNKDERISKDREDVIKALANINEIPCPTKMYRIGKYSPNKSRGIKICFDSEVHVKKILRDKKALPDNIKVYSDQTRLQQQLLQDLRNELSQRQKNGENNITIKYIRGLPKIVEANPKN